MSDDLTRLAVLIDADNTSPKMTREMFEELAGYGTLTVKRAYGDWTNDRLRGWKAHLHKHAISPIQQFANTSGKNATDSALIIDAMDLLYAGNLDGFVIVSSDADFTRLATRLRESGKVVYGVGQRKTPKPFQDACDKFTFLEVLRDPESEPDSAADPAPSRGGSGGQDRDGGRSSSSPSEEDAAPVTRGNLQSKLTKALNKMPGDDDNWATVGALGNHLNRTDPSFDPRTYDFAKLSDLVKAQPYLETKSVQGSNGRSELWARLKGAKPAARGEGRSEGREGRSEARAAAVPPAGKPDHGSASSAKADGGSASSGRTDASGRPDATVASTGKPAAASSEPEPVTSEPAARAAAEPTPVEAATASVAPGADASTDDGPSAAPPTSPTKKSATKKATTTKTATTKAATTKTAAKKAAKKAGATKAAATGAASDEPSGDEPTPAKKTARTTTRKSTRATAVATEGAPTGSDEAATAPAQPDEVAPAVEEPATSTVTVTTRTRRRATRPSGPADD